MDLSKNKVLQGVQGVSYSKKFLNKHGFPNLAKSKSAQFMFSKYLIEYQTVKIVKSKFKCEKSNKNKHKSNVVLKETEKKRP